jgi:hypothetical protein
MAVERIFDEADISHLIEQNSAPPYGSRNAALIIAAVCWGLTPIELSLLSVEDVIAPNGEFYRIWVLPEHASFNGESREAYTEDHLLPFFEGYADFRLRNDWAITNRNFHRGLNPNSKFFLNDKGEPFKLTERNHNPGTFQPRAMTEHIKKMLSKSSLFGATPASLRDSYIKGMYENGLGWTELKKVSGIKQKRTLEKKVRPHERELETVLKGLFSRVKLPDNLK